MNAIETTGLTKRFRGRTAVDDLNLTIAQGEFFALLGQNGAGKTTTIRMLTCLLAPSAGDALLMGESIARNAEAAKAHSNLSPQETALRGFTVQTRPMLRGRQKQPCGNSAFPRAHGTGRKPFPAACSGGFQLRWR